MVMYMAWNRMNESLCIGDITFCTSNVVHRIVDRSRRYLDPIIFDDILHGWWYLAGCGCLVILTSFCCTSLHISYRIPART